MKKAIIFLCVCWSVMACSKNSPLPDMVGKWQLTAIFLQPTGTGSWHDEDSIPPDYIQFNRDGSLGMSRYVSALFGGPVSYRVASDSTMIFNYPNGANTTNWDNIFGFRLTDSVLLLTPPAMELVIEKFIRVQ